jgi:nicotinamide riboside kinase
LAGVEGTPVSTVLPLPLRIAVLGAESTGKTTVARALAEELHTAESPVVVVHEVLREWCNREGRTPRAEEQRGIAQEQARRAETAWASTGVVADTTPLMTAVYSELLFGDRSLYGFALAHQRHYHLTLLTGLDVAWVADGLQRDGPHVREPVDAMVRAALARAGIAFHTVYGQGDARLGHAISVIENAMNSIAKSQDNTGTKGQSDSRKAAAWSWPCDKCSDPACEHRLFTDLLGR